MSYADFVSYMEALSPMERSRLQDRVRLTGILQKGRAASDGDDDSCDDEWDYELDCLQQVPKYDFYYTNSAIERWLNEKKTAP